jgi:hypothetical protein
LASASALFTIGVDADGQQTWTLTPEGVQVANQLAMGDEATVNLASDVEGLRLVLETALGREYRVKVAEDGSVVGLWRLTRT